MPDARTAAPLMDAVRALRPLVLEHADAAERERRVPTPVIEAMTKAGVFHMLVPETLGGGELHPAELLATIEELGRADASVAWVAMIGATSNLASAYFEESIAREVFGSGPGVIAAGIVAPRGVATPVEGGHRISGRWPFASGCQHSQWIELACMVEGQMSVYFPIVPASEVEIHDTWDVSGLRATGSHDVSLKDVFVPQGRGFFFFPEDKPRHNGTLYNFSLLGVLSVALAAVALGVGRGALDDFRDLAGAKTPTGRRKPLADWNVAQVEYAQAEGALRSGRAFLLDAIGMTSETIERGDMPTNEERALIRLAATTAVQGAVRAVDAAYNLAGGSAIYSKSTLQRRFRDIHALTAHVMVGGSSLEAAGRALLGLTVPPGFL